MSEWKKYRLGNLVDINRSSIDKNYSHEIIEYIDTASVTDNKFSEPQLIELNNAPSRAKRIVMDNDIIYSTVRPNQRHYGFIKNAKANTIVSTGFAVLTAKQINPQFLYYYLTREEITNYFNGIAEANTTTFPAFNASLFNTLSVSIPDLPTQQRIASILSSLDDKIELNRQMNQTLEDMAQTLFREMCVPKGKKLPEGWRKGKIGELFDYVIGGDWGESDYCDNFSHYCAVIRGTDINNILRSDFSNIPYRYIKSSNVEKRKLKDGDIVFEISGGSKEQATGRNLLITKEILSLFQYTVIPASFCRLIRTNDISICYFLAIYLKLLYNNGLTWNYQIQSTGISNFQFRYFSEQHEIIIPKHEIISELYNHVKPLYSCIGNNLEEIQALTQLRDSLLPKLMSGEIEV
jgi:type I restriction enzyme S subunit